MPGEGTADHHSEAVNRLETVYTAIVRGVRRSALFLPPPCSPRTRGNQAFLGAVLPSRKLSASPLGCSQIPILFLALPIGRAVPGHLGRTIRLPTPSTWYSPSRRQYMYEVTTWTWARLHPPSFAPMSTEISPVVLPMPPGTKHLAHSALPSLDLLLQGDL
jgi:hypothetical protein